MKYVLIFFGVLTGLFAVAQFLQLLGLIGVGFSVDGVGLTLLGVALAATCFKNAFAPPPVNTNLTSEPADE